MEDPADVALSGFRGFVGIASWTELIRVAVRHTFQRGDILFAQGQPGGVVRLLSVGRVKVMYVGQDGNTVLLCLRGPGDLLGELAGGIGEQRMASVVAIERCVAYGLSDQDFHGRLRLGGLESKFRRYMVEKLRETAPRQWQTARASAEARLAELLLYAVKVAGPSHKTPMLVPLSQEEMADALGVVRSSVTSPLARWRMAGLVTVQHGGTEVLDPAGLRSIVRAAGL